MGGIIVIDADHGRLDGLSEPSTQQRADVELGIDFSRDVRIRKKFDVFMVGHGRHRVLVLKKIM